MTQYLYVFKDDATTTLAAGITAASPSLQVVSGGGALFPALGTAQAFIGTLVKAGNPAIKEVVVVTGRSGDNMTGLIRNFSGTGALTWNAGDTFALLQPAEAMSAFAQIINLQSQFTNYAADSGTASAYHVSLSPALNASVVGMPIRFMASHDNLVNPTFSDGITTAALIVPGIGGLPANAMRAGGIYVATFDGTTFQLGSAQRFDMILGQIGNGQVPASAVIQWEASLVIGTNQLSGLIPGGLLVNNIALPGSPTTATRPVNTSDTTLATTAFANPGTVASIPGLFKTPGGILVQFGTVNPAGGGATVTLPVSYSAAGNYLAFGISLASSAVQTWLDTAGKTASSFILHNSGGSSYWWTVGV